MISNDNFGFVARANLILFAKYVRRLFVIDRRRRKSTESFSVRPELLVNRRMDRPDPAMEACPLVTLR